jgi:hypothetical protein
VLQGVKRLFLLVFLVCVGTSAQADEPVGRPNLFAIGATAGTLGVGGEMSLLVYDTFVLRASASYYTFDFTHSETNFGSTTNYNFNVNGLFVGALVDWHPFRSGWRLSTGVRYVDLEFKDDDTNGGLVGKGIGRNNYTMAQVGSIHTTIKNKNAAAPYFGFGYDAAHFSREGVGFTLGFDAGALYAGDPQVKITTDKSVPSLAADIATEEAQLKSDIKKWYNFYPVLMLSGKLSF